MKKINIDSAIYCSNCNRRINEIQGEKFICCSHCGLIECFKCAGITIEVNKKSEQHLNNKQT